MLPRGQWVEFDSREFLAPSFKELVDAWKVIVTEMGAASAEEFRDRHPQAGLRGRGLAGGHRHPRLGRGIARAAALERGSAAAGEQRK